MSRPTVLAVTLLTLAAVHCGAPERPRLKITLGGSCKPSCASPQYEFMVLRTLDFGEGCSLAARTANPGQGSVVLEGVDVGPAEQVTIAVRVVCPTGPGGCPHDCFAAQKVTATAGAITLVLAQSTLPLCFTDPITELPAACAK